MKKIKLIILGIISFTYFQACKGQSAIELQQIYSTEIVGTWSEEEDPLHKLEFTNNGIFRIYYDAELIDTMTYSITFSCGEQTTTNQSLFLTFQDADGTFCQFLEAVNKDNSNMLSMTDMSGHLQIYNKVN